jgi:cytidylate kinase
VVTLRIDVKVRDYDMWRQAFEGDAGGREMSGVRRYRIFRPVDIHDQVSLDLDFDSRNDAEGFLTILREEVWNSPEKAPAKLGTPETRLVELVESKEYAGSSAS